MNKRYKIIAILLTLAMLLTMTPLSLGTTTLAQTTRSYDGTGTFYEMSALDQLASGGSYVLYGVNGDNAKAMNSTCSGGFFGGTDVTIADGCITNPATAIVWTIAGNATDGYTLYNEAAAIYAEINGTDTSSFNTAAASTHTYDISYTAAKGFDIVAKHAGGDARCISIYVNDFRTYKESRRYVLKLYMLSDAPLASPSATATATSSVTATPTPAPTDTPEPTDVPTATPEPTEAPTPTPEVAAVTCAQNGQLLNNGDTVALTCETGGVTIYWAQDDGAYAAYAAPLSFAAPTATITAYARLTVGGESFDGPTGTFTFYFTDGVTVPIVYAKQQSGTQVTVRGTVTWTEAGEEATVFTMQDETAGIYARQLHSDLLTLAGGDDVTLTGTVTAENGLTMLTDVSIASCTAGEMPEPIAVTIDEIVRVGTAEALESMYLCIPKAWMPYVGTSSVALADNTAAIYLKSYSDADLLTKSAYVTVRGVLLQSGTVTGYYLRAQDASWVTPCGAATVHDPDAALAAWRYGGGTSTAYIQASDGQFAWNALGRVNGGVWGTSKSSMAVSGWSNAQKYFEFSVPTNEYENLRLSADLRVSGAGPCHFKILYSTDGTNYFDFDGNTFSIQYYGSNDILLQILNNLPLPAACNNQDRIYLRFQLTDQINASGGEKASGNLNVTNVFIEGDVITSDAQITAVPNSSAVALNDTVTLSNAGNFNMEYRAYETSDYSTNTVHDEIAYTPYTEPVVLDVLPYVLQARTILADGTSRVYTFTYTQQKVAAITASSYGGTYTAGRAFAMQTATAGATITYRLITAQGTENEQTQTDLVYAEPLTFTSAQFPVCITAVASLYGCQDSDTLTVTLTEKVSGGEQLYFGQIHAHTNLSDGAGEITDAFAYAKNDAQNVDYIVITDHSNYLDSAAELGTMDGVNRGNGKWDAGKTAAADASDENFVAAYGYEMTWSGQYGHMNTFATDGFVSRNNAAYTVRGGAGLVAYYELLTQYPQSISQFNHPGTTFGDFEDFSHYEEDYDEAINLIEVGNGEGKVGSSMYWPSYEYYNRALDKGWHLAPTNNQDNHKGNWGDSNTCRDVIWTNNFTEEGLYQAMRERRLYATEDDNLEVTYFLNDEPLGSVLENRRDQVYLDVTVYDPDASDKTFTLSVIVDGGKTVYTESGVLAGAAKSFSIELAADYAYYYVRIDQADGDIAVTAPCWIGEVTKAGVTSVSVDADLPTVGEQTAITVKLYNNEASEIVLTGATYTLTANGGVTTLAEKTAADLRVAAIPSAAEVKDVLSFTPTVSGAQTISVSFTGLLNGTEVTLTGSTDVTVYQQENVLHVALDASHCNEYVSGNYAGYYAPLRSLVTSFNGKLHVIQYGLTDEALANIDLLIISVPYVSNGTEANGKPFSAAELAAIRTFADNGGSILLTGRTSYIDTDPTAADTMNGLLAALGSDTRFDGSQVSVDGYSFTLSDASNFNLENPYTAGYTTSASKSMAFHTPTAITLGANASAVVTTGDAVLVSSETMAGGGDLIVAGMAIFNSYQLTDGDTDTMNYHVMANIMRRAIPVSTIAEVRAAGEGQYFVIEGVLTTNASGHSQATAFFDSVYCEDATGGINIFPIAGNYEIGQTVWISGVTSSYQGEYQLKDATLYVAANDVQPLAPQSMSTLNAMNEASYGKLVIVEGVITRVVWQGDLLEYLYVDDGSGEARVFLDGYITSDSTYDHSWIETGKQVRVTGVSSLGMTPDESGVERILPRLRIRDRAEIVDPNAVTVLLGDVNLDTTVTAQDAAFLMRALVALDVLNEQQSKNACVTGGTIPTANDAAQILRFTVGLIKSF